MPSGGLIVGGLGAAAGGIAGATSGATSNKLAIQSTNAAVNAYLNVLVPDPNEQKILLQQYQMTGKMDPRLETAFQQAKSNMGGITTDPALQEAQQSALSSLQNEAENGGHTLAQDAELNANEQRVNAENRGREGAIEERFAERGMGQPSGLMLSAEEQNNQNMTQNENEASLRAAAEAQHNALEALQAGGTMAGQQQQQQFNQKASVAQAQDSINQFNAQMNQGVENANTAAQNQAQAYNVQEGQQIANQNTGLKNYEQQYNKQLTQQQYQNQMQKAQGLAAANENQAGLYTQQGQNTANMWGNIGQGALKTGVGVGQVYGNRNSGGGGNATSGTSSGDPNAGESYDQTTWG